MEFPFRLASFLGAPPDCTGPYVGIIDEAKLRGERGPALCEVLDVMGKASGAAQGLRKPVTTGMPHLPGQHIYLLASGRTALGFLKVGRKRLYVTPPPTKTSGGRMSSVGDNLREVNPICALDFYVHESCQRTGYGRQLFDAMLRSEGLQAAQLAYDRPSPKLKAFLAKHFGLARFRPQNNNYVIFDDYFEHHRVGRASEPPDELRPPPGASRPPLPHPCGAAAEAPGGGPAAVTAVDHGGASQPGGGQPGPGVAPRWCPQDRGRTPRTTNAGASPPGTAALPPWGTTENAQQGSGQTAALQMTRNGTPASGYEGRTVGPAPVAAGMPSAGARAASQRARSTSALGSSRSRVSSAGTDPDAGSSWGRVSAGNAGSRFASPLSHAGRSMVMR